MLTQIYTYFHERHLFRFNTPQNIHLKNDNLEFETPTYFHLNNAGNFISSNIKQDEYNIIR